MLLFPRFEQKLTKVTKEYNSLRICAPVHKSRPTNRIYRQPTRSLIDSTNRKSPFKNLETARGDAQSAYPGRVQEAAFCFPSV